MLRARFAFGKFRKYSILEQKIAHAIQQIEAGQTLAPRFGDVAQSIPGSGQLPVGGHGSWAMRQAQTASVGKGRAVSERIHGRAKAGAGWEFPCL